MTKMIKMKINLNAIFSHLFLVFLTAIIAIYFKRATYMSLNFMLCQRFNILAIYYCYSKVRLIINVLLSKQINI